MTEYTFEKITPTNADAVTHHKIELEDGQVVHIVSSNPYGFFKIHFNRGQVPEYLNGQYTEFDYAKRDVLRYLHDKGRVVKDKKV